MRLCGPSFRCVLKRIKRRRRKGTLNCREIATAAMLVTGFLPFIAGPPAAADARVVLDFGDSLTAGLGLPRENAFPVRLEARLNSQGFAVRVVNAGVSGDTTAGGLARLDRALGQEKPDMVILELGANDALRGIQPAKVRANIDAMITRIQQSGAQLVLTGMLAPPNWGEEYRRAFDQVYPELARAHDVPIYPFFLEGVALNPLLNQPDGLHPNEKGVAELIERIAPIVIVASSEKPTEQLKIPVLTKGGIIFKTPGQYEKYTKNMGHLPIMSKSYIFGNTIPTPNTDKNGNIHVITTDQTSEEPGETAARPPSHGTASHRRSLR